MDNYYIIFTLYRIYLSFRKNNITKYKTILNNNYISRSTINIYYKKLTSNFIMNECIIFPYLYAINFKIKLNEKICEKIKKN